MITGKTIAFHSYKGGTGKTTLISNLAAIYAQNGKKVCLLDFDLYAPSLLTYFRKSPTCYINDLLRGEADISDVLVDVSSEVGVNGKFLLGFSSSKKEDISEIEIKHELKWQLAAMRRLLAAKNQLFEKQDIDCLLLDTGPGLRYWSINTLAAADAMFLVLKMSDMDIEGTKNMVRDIYSSLSRFGSKYYIILNKISGASSFQGEWDEEEKAMVAELERDLGAKVVSSIPCFCDVQFSRHEFLWALKQPDHPFSKRIVQAAEAIENI